jgi:hypothetical protein
MPSFTKLVRYQIGDETYHGDLIDAEGDVQYKVARLIGNLDDGFTKSGIEDSVEKV